jgi:hypothetical protein
MHLWEIRTEDRTLYARGSNWLVAVGQALDQLGLPAHTLAGLVVEDSTAGTIRARALRTHPAESVRLIIHAVNAARSLLDEDDPTEDLERFPEEREPETLPGYQQPLPRESTLEEDTVRLGSVADGSTPDGPTMLVEPPTALPEKIFDLGQQITLSDGVDAAADRALTILREFVPVRSGAVLYASMDDVDLRFLAAHGPGANALRGRRVPFDQGVAGWCFQTGEAVLVHDASAADLPLGPADAFPDEDGVAHGAILATPIVDERGRTYGCIELQHPEDRFLPWHVDAARVIANQLALYFRAWSGDPY